MSYSERVFILNESKVMKSLESFWCQDSKLNYWCKELKLKVWQVDYESIQSWRWSVKVKIKGACLVLSDTFIIFNWNMGAWSVIPNTLCLLCSFFVKGARNIEFLGKGGKRLQTSNQEIELLQQDLDNALQEIYRL